MEITKIGIGTNGVGGHNLFVNLDENQGVKLVHEAINQGITLIDTANVYGFGRSEELVGQAIKGHRHNLQIATKGAEQPLEDGTAKITNKPEFIRAALEKILK